MERGRERDGGKFDLSCEKSSLEILLIQAAFLISRHLSLIG